MKTRPTRPRGTAATAAATALLATALLTVPTATASPASAHDGAELARVMAALKRDATVPGTAWGVDPVAGRVVLSLDSTVTGARLARVRAAAAAHGTAVRTERVAGRFRPLTAGGDPIFAAGGVRCTLGFNVRKGSGYHFLTAGHCTAAGTAWYADPGLTKLLGHSSGSSFPGDDYGLVTYASTPEDLQGGVRAGDTYQDIVGAGNPAVGQTVTRAGQATGVRTGRVTALNQTVNYREGSVGGLIRTTICSEPGDSGGPLYMGDRAVGMVSGGSGDCASGGTTFFQPIAEPLQAYGVVIY